MLDSLIPTGFVSLSTSMSAAAEPPYWRALSQSIWAALFPRVDIHGVICEKQENLVRAAMNVVSRQLGLGEPNSYRPSSNFVSRIKCEPKPFLNLSCRKQIDIKSPLAMKGLLIPQFAVSRLRLALVKQRRASGVRTPSAT